MFCTEIRNEIELENAAIVAIVTYDNPEHEVNASLDELERLLDTAGGKAVIRMVQNKENPDVRTFLGSGKIKELGELCRGNGVKLVVADTELSPSQIRNMEDALNDSDGDDIRVIDRSMLILDIFALHATSAEGKLQVELAQLKYTVPRLIGKGLALSRQGGSGSIAARGPGETKLESDRRHIKRRMYALEEEIREIERHRVTQRKQRDRSGICKVAIVGYTNAGKSTLLNRLTDAGILAEDKLFATLDPTTRKFTLPDGAEVLLVDTVGFIRNLPHHLIKAFRSTLDEASYADMIIMMTDASDPEAEAQLGVTEKLLSELGAGEKPTLCVFNKCDREGESYPVAPSGIPKENVFYVSAKTGENIGLLVSRISELVNESTARLVFEIPMSRQDEVAKLYRFARVEEVSYLDDLTVVTAVCDKRARGMFEKWLKK